MAKNNGGLGRGLGSLFADSEIDLSILNPQAVSINPEYNSGAKEAAIGVSESEAEALASSIAEYEHSTGDALSGKPDAYDKPGSGAGGKKDKTVRPAAKESGGKSAGKTTKTQRDKTPESVVFIGLDDIKPNGAQPRKVFSKDALEDLAASIKEHGVIQPVLLRPSGKGYELVAGERRWRAARMAGLRQVPAIVRNLDERQNMFYALIENMQREDLNSIEEALGMQEMMETFSLTQEETAKAVGKSRSYVSNALRLLKLPEAVKSMVMDGKLTAGHARAIAGLGSRTLQLEAAEKSVAEGWSVRQIESYTGEKKRPAKRRKIKEKDRDMAAAEEMLSQNLGTRVRLEGTDKKGKIILEYYSREELDRLVELLTE